MLNNVTNLSDKQNPFLEVNGGDGSGDTLDEHSKVTLSEFNKKISDLNREDIPYQEKLDAIIELNTRIVPLIFEQLLSPAPSIDISIIASRACNALKDASSIIIKKREAEVSDDIDVTSPKFQLVFGWFIELFSQILHIQGIDEIQVSNIFNSLASELVGWEDKISKRLRGLSSKALDRATNPFIEDFKAKLKTPLN